MKIRIGMLFLSAQILFFTCCHKNTEFKIRQALIDLAKRNSASFRATTIDSLTYSLADSSAYYNHFLNLLSERSESFSRMAKLRTDLAQSHIEGFLSVDKKDYYSAAKNKIDLDKSIEDLKQNEREWNIINDSMDLMLNAVHALDTLMKVFYEVKFSSNILVDNKNVRQRRKAILDKDNFKVVLVE